MRTVDAIAALGVKNRQFAVAARSFFTTALKRGTLTRRPCEITGEEPAGGHHFDYARPLDVIWLSRKAHGEVHGAINRMPLGLTTKQLRAGLLGCMGKAGVLKLKDVAERAGLVPRALNLTDGTSVGTLQKIAIVLRCRVSDLVAEVEAEP